MPSTAATIGVFVRASWRMKRSEGASLNAFPARDTKSAMSLPAQKMPGTPANTTAPTASDSSAEAMASRIASYMSPVSAFFFSGRFKVTRRTPFPSSVIATFSLIPASPTPRHSEIA